MPLQTFWIFIWNFAQENLSNHLIITCKNKDLNVISKLTVSLNSQINIYTSMTKSVQFHFCGATNPSESPVAIFYPASCPLLVNFDPLTTQYLVESAKIGYVASRKGRERSLCNSTCSFSCSLCVLIRKLRLVAARWFLWG